MFERLMWWLYEKKPFKQQFIDREERKRRAMTIKQGLNEEFWKVLSAELRCSIQNERNYASRQKALGHEKEALLSSILAEAILKILDSPISIFYNNQDVVLEVEKIEKRLSEKPKKAQTSRYDDIDIMGVNNA